MKCLKCGRQHHISIFTSDTNIEVKSLHTPNVEGSASLPQSQTSCSPPRGGRPTVLYVNASTPILLQTAKAAIYRPGQPNEKFLARLILDSGSQRSYVTTTVKDKLRLPSERKQTISVKTFGSTEENTQSVDVVHLCITTIANSWLSLCSGLFLSNQPVNKLTSSIEYDHEKRQISKHYEGSMSSSNYGQSLNCSKFSLGTTEKSMIYSKANACSKSFSIKN